MPTTPLKTKAPSPFNISFWKGCSLLFWVVTWINIGNLLAIDYSIFKSPKIVESMPLMPDHGVVYSIKKTLIPNKEWLIKRKEILTQEKTSISLTNNDLNNWSTKAINSHSKKAIFKDINLKLTYAPWLENVLNSIYIQCQTPYFNIQKEKLYTTQPTIVHIGSLEFPLILQWALIPYDQNQYFSWKISDLSIGSLYIGQPKGIDIAATIISKYVLYKNNNEVNRLSNFHQKIEGIQLDDGLLTLKIKPKNTPIQSS